MIAPFGPDGPLPHGFSMPKPFLRSLRVFPLFIMSSALVACAGAPEVERDPQARIERYLENAYRPDAPLAVTAWDDVWTLGEMPVDVSWMGPTQPQAAPLILYLPGLGEDSRAAARWRRAWAEAGYAVLSLQPVSEGRAVYSSAEAQVGSFRSLAQKHFSREALALRVRVVDEAQAELRRQAATGRPELTGIDWQRVAVAGFDLGAQTAAALAGERDTGATSRTGWMPVAALLFSPYVENASDPARFAHIEAPVFTATGPRDEDPFSWIASPDQRQRLWQQVRVPGSYQLLAWDASHRALGGATEPVERGMAGRAPEEGRPEGPPPGAGSNGPRGAGGPGGPGKRGPVGGRMGHGQGMDDSFNPHQVANLQAVSLAFLDATVRQSAAARHWLDNEAVHWLGERARLERN